MSLSITQEAADTVGKLGTSWQIYEILRTLLQIDWKDLARTNKLWNELVREMVRMHDDPRLDLDRAYDLMDKQNNKCRHCGADLMLSRDPIILRSDKMHRFLGMTSQVTKFVWICNTCHPDNRKHAEMMFGETIERMLQEEEGMAEEMAEEMAER